MAPSTRQSQNMVNMIEYIPGMLPIGPNTIDPFVCLFHCPWAASYKQRHVALLSHFNGGTVSGPTLYRQRQLHRQHRISVYSAKLYPRTSLSRILCASSHGRDSLPLPSSTIFTEKTSHSSGRSYPARSQTLAALLLHR